MSGPEPTPGVAVEAFISIRADGTITTWNAKAEQLFGYSQDQACGARIDDLIIPARYRDAHQQGLARVVDGRDGRVLGRRLRVHARHRDGHEFPVDLTVSSTQGPAGWAFHAFAHDITAQLRRERFAAVEVAVAHGLAAAASSGEAAARVVEALGVRMGWPVAELWLIDHPCQLLRCAARHTDRDIGAFAVPELDYGSGVPGRVCQRGQPVWVPDLAKDTSVARNRIAGRYGLRAAVGIPITSGDRMLGALSVYGDQPEDPEDSLIGLLGGIAAHVGQFLERRRAEELAIELARTKDEFLSLVTHELRNPIAVIATTLELLNDTLDELPPDELRRHLAVLTRHTDRLRGMTGDLLDLARLESGQLSYDPQPVDLGGILTQAVDAIALSATAKQLTLQLHAGPDLHLHADPGRLRQVADNLLSNAVKYTPAAGSITVTACPDAEQAHIDWTVADTGIGIPAAERPRLFRRFYRASTALDRCIPGTVLGLVITRTIIEAHHGSITIADRPEPGTTFHIRLPIKPPQADG